MFNSTQKKKQPWQGIVLLAFFLSLLALVVVMPLAKAAPYSGVDVQADTPETNSPTPYSHRLIVQLESPSLVEMAKQAGFARLPNGRLDVRSPQAQAYMAQLEAEQVAFINRMASALPGASVATYINESGQSIEATYQVVFNGVAVDPGDVETAVARRTLAQLPGVKAVYLDFKHYPDLYASLPLINAQAVWDQVGGQDNAGAGIKVASMDGGVHHDAPMFDGTGFTYPPGFPAGGLGDTANNNGKIIASRAYFRPFDPPASGDENTWPGENGTSHGVHTSSTAAGNSVTADYLGITETLSGVAPGAWMMSYRVFYASVLNDGSFHNVEGIAALDDIVMDGADVLNNSWGGGPGSVGGEFDPLDQALINAADAGIFISMSAGNAGPGLGTSDHPSPDYINVAASTTSGTYASGRLSVTAPEPISTTLQNMPFANAAFGSQLPPGDVFTYTFVSAAVISPTNFEGCNPWPAGTFTGQAALISRGACEFGVKVLNAEDAGAEFVVVHNSAAGGDMLLNMGPGAVGHLVTIPSVFIYYSRGVAMTNWYATYGAASVLTFDTTAFQAGNTPDLIASFSSRGPGVGNVLKPDIAAPGVNILAQGYASGVTGEARHLGYGQVSGTSMAAPHVAGAAAVLRQIHPDWSNAYIKSALMTTAQYMNIYIQGGNNDVPAQPLDMGAGRLDLTDAADPGVILDPPSLSHGLVPTGTVQSIVVTATSVAAATETYTLTTLFTGNGFAITQTTSLTGFVVSPATITVAPGASATFTVTFDAAQSIGIGDNQGYIILEGDNGHQAHMPAWARVAPLPSADVLIIDNDFSFLLGFPDYLNYYTNTLDSLGITYDVWDADANYNNPTTIPDAATLSTYKAIIYYTGDNFYPNGSFTVQTPLTALDMNRLTEYANSGGIVIAMGQDMSSVLNDSFFDDFVLGDEQLQDSVTLENLPNLPVVSMPDAPPALQGVSLDLSGGIGAVALSGVNEVPPVATTMYGWGTYTYDDVNNVLDYGIEITVTIPTTVTASHIHTGTVGVNGGVAFTLLTGPILVTDTYSFGGQVTLSEAQESVLLSEGFYTNVHTNNAPGGEIRGQVIVNGDGAGNQFYIDEMSSDPSGEPIPVPGTANPYVPLLKYPGPYNIEDGVVAMAHRSQPTLEYPGISYYGRSIYTSFGLEGVNDGLGATSRAELLGTFLDWAMDEPAVVISNVTSTYSGSGTYNVYEATLSSNISGTTGISYRWDFGDGSPYTAPTTNNSASHLYAACGTYTVRVEAADSWGNRVIGELEVEVTNCLTPTYVNYLPVIMKP